MIRYDVGRDERAAAKVFMQIRNTLHHTFQSLHRIGIRFDSYTESYFAARYMECATYLFMLCTAMY